MEKPDTIGFHRLEEYKESNHIEGEKVICSFETDRLGYLQVGCRASGPYELRDEPGLYTLRDEERRYVEWVVQFVWALIFEYNMPFEAFK